MRLVHLINSTSLSLKIIDHTLIDVGNSKHQNITAKNQLKYTHNLTFRCECSSPLQGTAASKVQLTSAHSQLHRSQKVSLDLTLFQTDLRITDPRGHTFPPSQTLLSVQNANRMASRLTAIASFPSVRQQPIFTAPWALMTKTDLTFPALSSRFVDFAGQFCFRCKFSFHDKRHSSQV